MRSGSVSRAASNRANSGSGRSAAESAVFLRLGIELLSQHADPYARVVTDPAGIRLLVAYDEFEEGGLAGPVGAYDAGPFAALETQLEAFEKRSSANCLMNVFQPNHVLGGTYQMGDVQARS